MFKRIFKLQEVSEKNFYDDHPFRNKSKNERK